MTQSPHPLLADRQREPFVLLADAEGDVDLERVLSDSKLAWHRVDDPRLVDPGAASAVIGSVEAVRPWLDGDQGPIGVVIGNASAPDAWFPGVRYWLRAPIDGPVLRLLMSHLLAAQSADRRMAPRVALELGVRVRTGLRLRSALLTELSVTGARIDGSRRLRPGSRVEIRLPAGRSGARPCWVGARVLRTLHQADGRSALAFTRVPLAAQERIRSLVRTATVFRPETEANPTPAAVVAAAEPAPSWQKASTTDERLGGPRRAYARRVIARGECKPRVLLGCDLSTDGMRVEPDAELGEGELLEVALHVRQGEVPLVLRASVDRDDHERGMFLRFDGVGDEERKFLSAMLSELPALEGQRGSLVVSEVL